jgi:phosphatidate cytidylyltransferase
MGDWTDKDKRFSELGLRLASAAVLIPVALWMVYMGGARFAVACAVFGFAMMWEWAQMSAFTRPLMLGGLMALSIASLALQNMALSLGLAAATLVFAVALQPGAMEKRGVAVLGVVYVGAMLAGFWYLRQGPWDGRSATLYFMSFVWASDAAAYFVGRGVGGPRLIPSESPNKTWAGAIGAVIACGLCGLAAANIENMPIWPWVATGIAISVIAQAGDLFESSAKRRFKVKDSSSLLPGHGGVLDRVDGLGAVACVMALALIFMPWLIPQLGLDARP